MKPRAKAPKGQRDAGETGGRKPKHQAPARPYSHPEGEGRVLKIDDGPVDGGGRPWTGPPPP